MIESRNKDDVVDWLKSFPNLTIVSRDGSLIYRDAIEIAHPTAIQVSDRFHLLKNFTDYCCKFIKSIIKNNLEIHCDNGIDIVALREKYKFDTKWEIICAVKDLDSQGFSIKEIQDVLELNFRTVKKYISVTAKEKKKYDKKPKYIAESEEKLKKRLEIQKEIRALVTKGISYRKIETIIGIDRRTAKKYAETDDLTDGRLGQRKYGKITPYISKIQDLLLQRYTKRKIYEMIKQDGYDGCESLIREYLQLEIRNQKMFKKNCFTEIIQRQKIISLLYKPLKNIDGLEESQLNKIIEMFPQLNNIFEALESFRCMIKAKDDQALDSWLNQTEKLGIEGLTSFVTGVRRDIEAVRNGIISDINNGLAEGSVNKLKVIKRIMYGRCKFDLLKKKAICLQYI